MKISSLKTVYISGASKGIGFGWAKKFLMNGTFVVGVARNTEPLQEWASENNVSHLLKVFNVDLSNPEKINDLQKELDHYDFDVMINNAGFGGVGLFSEHSLEKELNMIDLNIKALHIMTKYFVKRFSQSLNEKRIINLGSIAAFMPGPGHATYFASKAYVLSLSNAIDFELKKQKSKLRVITVCPGSTVTDFWNRAELKSKKLPVGTMTLDKFLKLSFKKMLTTKKATFIVGAKNRAMIRLKNLASQKTLLNITYKSQK